MTDDEGERYVARSMVAFELEEAAQHLNRLARRLATEPGYGDPEFRVDLGHVYAHLNRAWNRRAASADAPTDDQFEAWSQFPADVPPVG